MPNNSNNSYRNEQLYANKNILAPMVRVSTLPMRLLALQYGADLVYCEEIIDRKILMCQQQENELLGTTDFILSDGTIVFRTCPQEKDRLIFQIGTSDADRALAAAKKIQDFVAGVDVNMGCPKEFSIKGGMGAALITNPEKVRKILTALVQGLSIPVTCKIRCLPELEDTIKLVKVIEETGVSAIAVHGRTKTERTGNPCRNHYIRAVAKAVNIPVIANGGSKSMTSRQDIDQFKKDTGTRSVMVARAAEWNCSVFRQGGPLPITTVLKEYLRYAFVYDNSDINTKYCVLQMLRDKMTEMLEGDKCLAAKTLEEFAEIWDVQEEYADILKKRKERTAELTSLHSDTDNSGVKRRKLDNGNVYIELPVRFDKRLYAVTMTPKQMLNNWVVKCKFGKPVYQTTERPDDRQFNSCVSLDGKTYSNPYWEKSKQLAEQSAAIACLIANGQEDGRLKESQKDTDDLRHKWKCMLSDEDWLKCGDNDKNELITSSENGKKKCDLNDERNCDSGSTKDTAQKSETENASDG